MKIKYKLVNGEALDFSFKKDNYVLLSDEYFAVGANEITDELVEASHSASFKTSRDIDKQKKTCVLLLLETDYKMLSDYAYPSNQAAWVTYRQQLRDIITNAVIVTIPDKPF